MTSLHLFIRFKKSVLRALSVDCIISIISGPISVYWLFSWIKFVFSCFLNKISYFKKLFYEGLTSLRVGRGGWGLYFYCLTFLYGRTSIILVLFYWMMTISDIYLVECAIFLNVFQECWTLFCYMTAYNLGSVLSFWSYLFKLYNSSVQLFSHVWLFATPWTAAHQASLSITHNSYRVVFFFNIFYLFASSLSCIIQDLSLWYISSLAVAPLQRAQAQ